MTVIVNATPAWIRGKSTVSPNEDAILPSFDNSTGFAELFQNAQYFAPNHASQSRKRHAATPQIIRRFGTNDPNSCHTDFFECVNCEKPNLPKCVQSRDRIPTESILAYAHGLLVHDTAMQVALVELASQENETENKTAVVTNA